MTDNEKAATFIGWAPSEGFCEENQNKGDGPNFVICWKHGGITGVHKVPTPDMTDPRNYMKALEAVARTQRLAFTFAIDETGFVVTQVDAIGAGGGYDDPASFGSAIVKTLAALYDTEHAVTQV